MFIRRNPYQPANCARPAPFRTPGAALTTLIIFAFFLAGCGGSKSSANNTVAQVTLSPSTASLVAGQVLPISASAVNSAGTGVATTFTFSSSNPAVATVSPQGQVCGGVWDSLFQVCNAGISGTATITATAQAVTSGPLSLTVHPSVTSVTVDPLPLGTCLSVGETHQFTPHAFHNGQEITSQVGNFSWSASDSTVTTVDANGLATARIAGLSGIVASIGSTTSPATPFKTCMPVVIDLHIAGDPAGNFTRSVDMNTTDTKTLQVDVIDEHGVASPAAPLTILSNNTVVATLSGAKLTAQSPGGAGLLAVCAPPTCGNGINTPIYSNLFSVTVNGSSPNTTTVYAASTFKVPTGSIMPLVPIDISKNPPVAGTPIALPGVPNSMVFNHAGTNAFIGTDVGLVVLDAAANTATLAAPPAMGKVLAVSPDGNKVIVSNAADDPATGNPIEPTPANQRVWVFDLSAKTLTTFIAPAAVAAAYNEDGFRAFIFTGDGSGKMYVFSPLQTFQTLTPVNLGSTSFDAVPLSSGQFVYVANSAGLQSIAACNETVTTSPPTNSSNIQLVRRVDNLDTIYAVDTTASIGGVDVITAAITPLTPPVTITPGDCAPNVTYNNNFVDFGFGPFTAHQLLVSSNGVHAAVLPVGTNKVFTILNGNSPGVAQLPAGATEALSGGLTPDGTGLWIGVGGTNTVDFIDLRNNVDSIQVPMSFKKADGSAAPPNLVVIRPK
jgi:trimeric autotransporter adhesin